jgi:hypothetical protein
VYGTAWTMITTHNSTAEDDLASHMPQRHRVIPGITFIHQLHTNTVPTPTTPARISGKRTSPSTELHTHPPVSRNSLLEADRALGLPNLDELLILFLGRVLIEGREEGM